MNNLPILSLVTFLPLVGAAFIATIRGEPAVVARNARNVALLTAGTTFFLSLGIWFNFDTAEPGFQFVERSDWMPSFGIAYHLGVDGISMLFVLLTTLLTPLCILASWESVTARVKEYMIAFLVMETMMVGTFCALDLILFYLFFESVLIPMFLIIGIWGGPRRIYSAFKFFLFTFAGSVLMFIALLTIYLQAGTTDIPTLMQHDFPASLQIWLWLAMLAGFAVKLPMWPVHTWLPDAHVEAPTAGSVILAGVLLKFGGYGFLRFSLPMLPEASVVFMPLMFGLGIVAIIYTSLVALAQEDMKKLIAYSSVAHMGYVTIGSFTLTVQGIQGSLFQMLSHGIVSAALFLVVGVVYDRIHSREISVYGGLVERMPAYALVFMIFMLASVGLPGTGGFIGEFLVMLGAFRVNAWVAAFTATGMILGAAYMLYLYRRVILGQLTKDRLKSILDLKPREILIFAPLLFLVIWMGVYPKPFLDVMQPSVDQLVQRVEVARANMGEPAYAGR
ncbi:MAG: NADH-quinone oxidoreductase subunit M [Rhodospirillales bacterium]|nr:NADH-quinone oxidoreductase subunit M [Rhodospirillales bacterium]